MKPRIGILFSAVLLLLLFRTETVSGQGELSHFEYKQVHMGVQARIVLFAPDSATARRAAVAAYDRIAELDQIMSDYRNDSELMQLCDRAGTEPVPVSDDLFTVLETAQRLARQSNGAFDVTIGPLVRLWREARRTERLPRSAELEAAQAKVGWKLMKLDSSDQTVELTVPAMQLDLGGIAKGYAADEALAALRMHGANRVLFEFGGDVVVGDPPPGKKGWDVAAALGSPGENAVVIENEAFSTSGDTQQFVIVDGTRYSHVVDPRTGIGLTDRTAATVVGPRGALTDALATTLAIMGPEKGPALISTYYPAYRADVRHLETPKN